MLRYFYAPNSTERNNSPPTLYVVKHRACIYAQAYTRLIETVVNQRRTHVLLLPTRWLTVH
jgi:hypothetical protein